MVSNEAHSTHAHHVMYMYIHPYNTSCSLNFYASYVSVHHLHPTHHPTHTLPHPHITPTPHITLTPHITPPTHYPTHTLPHPHITPTPHITLTPHPHTYLCSIVHCTVVNHHLVDLAVFTKVLRLLQGLGTRVW